MGVGVFVSSIDGVGGEESSEGGCVEACAHEDDAGEGFVGALGGAVPAVAALVAVGAGDAVFVGDQADAVGTLPVGVGLVVMSMSPCRLMIWYLVSVPEMASTV